MTSYIPYLHFPPAKCESKVLLELERQSSLKVVVGGPKEQVFKCSALQLDYASRKRERKNSSVKLEHTTLRDVSKTFDGDSNPIRSFLGEIFSSNSIHPSIRLGIGICIYMCVSVVSGSFKWCHLFKLRKTTNKKEI